tara:strand:- start:34 stop:924 length:891 start_codon:yes stop_codon:yes gene_type:complete
MFLLKQKKIRSLKKTSSLIFWFFSSPIKALIGLTIINIRSVKSCSARWVSDFTAKNVLIVGTGPSLNFYKDLNLERFDAVVYINYAAVHEFNNNNYLFSTDSKVAAEVWMHLKNIGREKDFKKNQLILAPVDYSSYFDAQTCLRDFTILRADKSHFISRPLNFRFLGLKLFSIPTISPRSLDRKGLTNWWLSEDQVESFPVVRTTSAISALLFVAKFSPKLITVLGCDFSGGRAKTISSYQKGAYSGQYRDAENKFYQVAEFLNEKGIRVQRAFIENKVLKFDSNDRHERSGDQGD